MLHENPSLDKLRERARLPLGDPRRERAIVELSRRLVAAMDERWQNHLAEQGTGQLEADIETAPQDFEDQ